MITQFIDQDDGLYFERVRHCHNLRYHSGQWRDYEENWCYNGYRIIAGTKIVSNDMPKILTRNTVSQPPPDVYNLFEEIILMSEGCIIYHGENSVIVLYILS